MPKANKPGFYAVHIGRQPGIYMTWDDCERQTKGYRGARYKKFSTQDEAEAFLKCRSKSAASPVAAVGNALASSTRTNSHTFKHRTPYSMNGVKKQRNRDVADVVDESGWDVVCTDGACRRNGQIGAVAGIGVWWGVDDRRNIAERCPGDQTNNRAELIALIRALETSTSTTKPLLIKTDSSYSISCVRDWIPSWKKRGWKTADGKDVKNRAIITYLSHLLDQRGERGQIVRLQHVRGHEGHVGNEGADTLAGLGASMPAIPERDWPLPEAPIPNLVKRDAIMDFQLTEDDILDSEELERMAENGEFD